MNTLPLVEIDPLLKPYSKILQKRQQQAVLRELEFTDGNCLLKDTVNHHLYYGLHKGENCWVFREKAPNAKKLFLYGDFSYWQINDQYALTSIGNGDWEIKLPLSFLKHNMLYKLWVVWQDGADERLPSYVNRVVQDETTKIFAAQVWDPEKPYQWKYPQPTKPSHPLIYEAHVGMSSEKAEISSYWTFKEELIPRIKKLGYNTIQLMAIQEHPYYGSFGYQVANFFAPSSRFGTPDELRELIDTAHHEGMTVLLDLVHSHSVSNDKEGLSHFDGNDYLYFHSGEKGVHPIWDSRCFNYGKEETILFLLSNLKYWMEEFRFDGFRFDGVTSMCYWDHGIGVDFLDYKQYFDNNVDEDAITYLTLANKLIKEINPRSISIAEDVSGMPGMAFPVAKGGIGFDYRMSMGISDFWTTLIKKQPDEAWRVGDLYFHMTDKRKEEETVNYAESHDQAMVGDKTIIFQLIDKDIYSSMSLFTPNIIADRGVALHKMIRLITLSLSSGGYLNFMGNEFGHPEWIDFPRAGNHWSFQYARRQWSLGDNSSLKYHALQLFDQAMIHAIDQYKILDHSPIALIQNNEEQLLIFYRNQALFIFNFNPATSFTDYEVYCPEGSYKVILNTDSNRFAGFNRIDETMSYNTSNRQKVSYLKLYIPSRSAFILQKVL
ncbi:MAG: alpha amylase C-terminal domain-containing protein [Bacteroidales bacterium]